MKLHLGCGKLKLDGYINIDMVSDFADLKMDFTDLSIFNKSTVDEIYICHALEHFKRNEIINVILEWNRVLKNNGILRIAVPDFEKIVKVYLKNKNLSELIGLLSGGQRDNYDFHYVNFDINILKSLLESCGFNNVERYDAHVFLKEKDDYSKSYIPHMNFKTGELMSLNVICKKKATITKSDLKLDDRLIKFTKHN